jgi:hypothetical protein
MNSIFFVGGCKGGVGKTFVSLALIDYIQDFYSPVYVFDTDTANPEIIKIYQNHPNQNIVTLNVNLDDDDGWMNLIDNLTGTALNAPVIINTAARNESGINKYGSLLKEALIEMNRDFITFWVINRQMDSLVLLAQFRKVFSESPVHVVRNNFFGEGRKFERYNSSNIRKTLEGEGGKSLDFPDLADRVADEIYTNHISISEGLKTLPLSNRVELKLWKNLCTAMFAQVIVPAKPKSPDMKIL